MSGPPPASNLPPKDSTRLRRSPLAFELLELALRELEDHGKEVLEPQCRTTLAAFSERLRVLGETIGGFAAMEEASTRLPPVFPASAKAEACSGSMPAMTQNASNDTPVNAVVEAADAAGGGKPASATEAPTENFQNIEGSQTVVKGENTHESRTHLKKLTQLFEHLDSDGSGSVGMTELSLSLKRMGLTQTQIRAFMEVADTSENGLVDRKEFLHAASNPEIRDILEQVQLVVAKRYPCMLSQSSAFRICWDVACSCALSYMAITEPLFLAFPDISSGEVFRGIAIVIDVLFLSDVALNFRTGFYTADNFEVMEPWEVTKNYVKTWFLLDLTSSVPFDVLSGYTVSDLQPLRLLKYWKILRVMKVFKITKSMEGVLNSEQIMDFYDWLRTTPIMSCVPLLFILAMTVLVCHWLACFMITSGDGFLGEYQDVSGNLGAEYVSGFYWAFTTISTVGYGDITPGSTTERLYSIVAMSIGGAFYGYFIARFTSIVTRSDYVKQVYTEKMSEVDIWLQHHQFPRLLRKRTRRYFERYLKAQTHIDDASILNSLNPELRREVCKHIVLQEVRDLPIFAGVPAGVMSRLAKILKRMDADASETLVRDGEVGSAMYIIVSGEVHIKDESVREGPNCGLSLSDSRPISVTSQIASLSPGDSFGEELLLNPTGLYEYTAIAQTKVSLQVLSVAAFLDEFGKYHDVFHQVRLNIESAMRERGQQIVSPPKPFETEVVDLLQEIRGSRAELSPRPFETEVLDQLREVQASQKEFALAFWNEMHAHLSRTSSPRENLSDSRLGFAKL